MIRVNAKDLLQAVTVANVAVDKKALPHIRIVAADGVLTVSGRDGTTEASAMVLCEGDLTAIVRGRQFLDAIAAATPKGSKGRPKSAALSTQLELNRDGNSLIVSGASTITVNIEPEAEYPATSYPELADPVKYDADGLASALDFTLAAASQDVTRYHLNAVFFKGPQMVSTDGHRLHLESSLPDVGGEYLLQRHGGEILRKVIRYSKAETVVASFGDGYASFTAGMATVTSKLTDAQFPPFEQVIPRNQDKVTVVDHRSFLSALKQGLAAASDRTGIVALCFGPECRVEAENPDFGSVKAPFTGKSDKEFKVGFNARYLVDFMEAFNGDSVRLEFDDELSPLKTEHDNRLAVIMPCRI